MICSAVAAEKAVDGIPSNAAFVAAPLKHNERVTNGGKGGSYDQNTLFQTPK